MIRVTVETHGRASLQTAQTSSSERSIVRVFRHRGEKQPSECELLRDAVPIDQLLRYVQINSVVVLVRVVQRAIRHIEEVVCGQTECVRGGGGDGGADLNQRDGSGLYADMTVSHTIKMVGFPAY